MKKYYSKQIENISMLSVSKTKHWPCWRQWLILPLIIAAFLMTNTEVTAQLNLPGHAPVKNTNWWIWRRW